MLPVSFRVGPLCCRFENFTGKAVAHTAADDHSMGIRGENADTGGGRRLSPGVGWDIYEWHRFAGAGDRAAAAARLTYS